MPADEAVLTTAARVVLQRRAPRVIRRHLVRAFIRVSVLVVADLAGLGVAQAALRALRDASVLGGGVSGILSWTAPRGALAGWQFATAMLLGLAIAGAYRPGDCRRDPRRVLAGVALAGGLILWRDLWIRGVVPVAAHYVVLVLGLWLLLSVMRTMVDWAVARLMPFVRRPESVLFVGEPGDPVAERTAARLSRAENMQTAGWVTVTGTGVSDAHRNQQAGGRHAAALGSVGDLWRIMLKTHVDTVVLCGEVSSEVFDLVVEASVASGCRLLAVSRYEGVGRVRPSLVWYRRLPFVELTVPSLRARDQFLKRLLDIWGATIGLVVVMPLFVLIAAAIRLDSSGPVLYRCRRWGRFGRTIDVLKFRTMVEDAADRLVSDRRLRAAFEHNIKLVRDPRVTRVGRFLRRWSLDEIPQLINVLLGHMSLVGPRPKLIGEEQKYGEAMETVLGVRPGMTGLWQVSGRNSTTYDERVALDVQYASAPTLWSDLVILARTLPVVVRGIGAH